MEKKDIFKDQKGALQQFNDEQKSVLEAMDQWIEAVTTRDPETVAGLYAPDAVFWGTVSPFIRTNPEGVRDYFEHFMTMKDLNAIYYKPMVRVYGDIAINSGYYTFFHTRDGRMESIAARYTFVYRREDDGRWLIIDHHSSAVPGN